MTHAEQESMKADILAFVEGKLVAGMIREAGRKAVLIQLSALMERHELESALRRLEGAAV